MAEQDLLRQLADIELPPMPNYDSIIWGVIGLITLLVACAIVWRRLHKIAQPAHKATVALIKLQEVEILWRTKALTPRETAFRLACLLRLGLGLAQLTGDCPASLKTYRQSWSDTITMLDQIRYPAQIPTDLPYSTFEVIRQWLTESCVTAKSK